ncbi:MAG TPA: molybdate ABC transporter permease subunit [Chloroflexota bacterium]|nr:molybdate ABC transporter permease subunit [Chloroflexota bacterium]
MDFSPLWLSLRVGAAATVLVVAAGLPLAWLLARGRFRGREVLSAALTLPMVLPPTVLGFYLLMALGRQGPIGRLLESTTGFTLVFTWYAAVLASFVVSLPLLVRAAQGAFEAIEPNLENAARTLGRSELDIFLTVTVPLAWRGILAGTVLAFARAIGEFGATLMVAGNIPGSTQTMPIAIYDAVQAGRLDVANTLVLIITGATMAGLLLLGRVARTLGR